MSNMFLLLEFFISHTNYYKLKYNQAVLGIITCILNNYNTFFKDKSDISD